MTNTAAVIKEAKARITVEDRPVPKPQASEILVKNHAVAINPVDWKIQDYCMFISQYPNVLGSDVSGIVEAVGSDVKHFKKGDRVAGYAQVISNNNIDHGAFQQYTLVYENNAAKLPSHTSFEEGALLPMAIATSGIGIFVCLEIPWPPSGKQSGGFLVWGASSAVGTAAVQIASSLGFTVFAVCSPHHHAYVKSLGASEVFDYNDSAVVKNVVSSAESAKHDIKYAFDAISENGTPPQAAAILDAFGGGKLVLTLPWPQDAEQPENVTVCNTGAFRIGTDQKEFGKWLFNDWLEKSLAEKSYKPSPAIERIEGGLNSVQKAFDQHKKGVSGKKLVIPL